MTPKTRSSLLVGLGVIAALAVGTDLGMNLSQDRGTLTQKASLDAEIRKVILDQKAQMDTEIRQVTANEIQTHPKEMVALITQELQREKAASNQITDLKLLAAIHGGQGPTAGDPNGVPVSVFVDLNCPYCRKFGQELELLLQHDPHVKIHIIDLAILTPGSRTGALAELALDRMNPDAAWPLYVQLEHATTPLDGDAVRAAGEKMSLKPATEDPADAVLIATNTELAHQVQLEGTPTVVIGNQIQRGAISAEAVEQIVQQIRGQSAQK